MSDDINPAACNQPITFIAIAKLFREQCRKQRVGFPERLMASGDAI